MSCPRPGCGGFVFEGYDATRCLNCGWYRAEPDVPPIVPNEAKRWESVLCSTCHIRGAIRGHNTCRQCWNTRKAQSEMG